MTDRCEGRYPVPHARTEPFDVTYRCGLHQGHKGPCGASAHPLPPHLHAEPFPATDDADNTNVVECLVQEVERHGHPSLLVSVGRIRQLLTELAASERRATAAEQAGRWRTMESAPKDGTQILMFIPSRYQGKGGISWACWICGEWLDSMAMRLSDSDISHWQPLPAPPADPTEGGT